MEWHLYPRKIYIWSYNNFSTEGAHCHEEFYGGKKYFCVFFYSASAPWRKLLGSHDCLHYLQTVHNLKGSLYILGNFWRDPMYLIFAKC